MNSQAEQEGEGVVGQQHEVHAGEEGREEGQHPPRFMLVLPVADAVEACGGAAEIDDGQKEGGERVNPEMSPEPRQSERERDGASARPPTR